MKRAFIVCGPPSSGNRLVGAILVRAGCWGEGSTNQPQCIDQIPSDTQNIVWIHPPHLERIPDSLRQFGFEEITFIIVIREPEANARSMMKGGFHTSLEDAYTRRIQEINKAISVALSNHCKIEIITYEGLSNQMLAIWLSKLGLPTNNLTDPLQLIGQFAPDVISNENSKHY